MERSRHLPLSLTGFGMALAARGIVSPESIIADGSIHRCDADVRQLKAILAAEIIKTLDKRASQ